MSETPSGTVLVLDDDLFSSAGLVAGLKRLGYTPRVAGEAKDAVTRAVAARPVVVLVNLAARALDSSAVVRALKAEPGLAGVPVVGFCGHMEVALIEAGRAAGCDMVVANSAISGDLPAVLRQALRRSS